MVCFLDINSVIASLEDLKDDKRLEFARRCYPTRMRIIGVTNPKAKLVLKEIKALTRTCTGREKIELAKSLVNTDIFECQYLAFEYLGKDKKALKALIKEDIIDFDRNLDNWVAVDAYSAYLVGYAWREAIVSTDFVKSFLKSEDFWHRRIALVATVALNQKARGGTGDAKRTLKICELCIDDHQDMMNKALSWALRELAKIEISPVLEFIQKHEQNLHPRVLREVKRKIETGTKY